MGISIMANKIVAHNPTNSNLFLVTNTICGARILKGLGDGDYSVSNSIHMEFFCVNK